MNATSIFQSTRALIPTARRAPRSFTVAQAVAWFSLVLGALEAAAPAHFARRLGLKGKKPLLRGYGGREIAAGATALVGFLGPAMWARAFGDLLDLAASRLGRGNGRHTARNISIAVGALAGIALIDLCVVALLSRRAR